MERAECTLYEYMGAEYVPVAAWIEDGKIYALTRENCKCNEEVSFFTNDGEFSRPESGELKGYCDPATVLLPFEMNGKWGYGNPFTHEIRIPAIFSFAWGFQGDYAVVCQGGRRCNAERTLEVGYARRRKHGVIDRDGNWSIPLEYDKIEPLFVGEKTYFIAKKQEKFGVLTACGDVAIAFIWDELEVIYDDFVDILLRCMVKAPSNLNARICHYGVYNTDFRLIVPAELTHVPMYCGLKSNYVPEPEFKEESEQNAGYDYFLLQKESKFGILCANGRLVREIELNGMRAVSEIIGLGGTFNE